MSATKLFILCLLIYPTVIKTARILAVFPVASISHQVVFRPVIHELARRGHEVVVITTDPAFSKGQTPPNLTEINTHDAAYNTTRDLFTVSAPKGAKSDLLGQLEIIYKLAVIYVELLFDNEEVIRMINDKSQKFDLLLLEAFPKSTLIFSHIYKAPVIQFSSFGALTKMYEPLGAPEHPLLYPLALNVRLNNLTIWDKIVELYNYFNILQLNENHKRDINKMFQKFYGKDVPDVTELEKNVDMMFLNIHPIFEGIRPVPPTVQYVPGLHQKPQKELPKDLKAYLDSSKNGVIYFSLGTNVDPTLLSADVIKIFVKVFSELPYDVLWKWNGDELPGRTDNIRISKWLPQSDLLRHPKVKVFITQGGLQSTDEAITAGVPMVGIPMLGDQWFNVERYVYHKIGVGLDFETLTEDKFKKAVVTVIEDESYRRNIVKLNKLMKDDTQSSLEKSMWWIEYVLRHGGAKHLRSPSAGISWADYLEIEVVMTLILAVIVLLSQCSIVLYLLVKFLKTYLFASVKVKGA